MYLKDNEKIVKIMKGGKMEEVKENVKKHLKENQTIEVYKDNENLITLNTIEYYKYHNITHTYSLTTRQEYLTFNLKFTWLYNIVEATKIFKNTSIKYIAINLQDNYSIFYIVFTRINPKYKIYCIQQNRFGHCIEHYLHTIIQPRAFTTFNTLNAFIALFIQDLKNNNYQVYDIVRYRPNNTYKLVYKITKL